MLSKNWQKFINSLQQKKYRQQHGAFVVEGAKSVVELLRSDFQTDAVFATEQFHKENKALLDKQPFLVEIATDDELSKIGTFQTNNAALAVAKTKPNELLCVNGPEIVLVLDDLRDPGNLGTVMRIADWYGLRKIVCSPNTVDVYNPKVIAATMGSFSRVGVYYTDLDSFLKSQQNVPVYGTFMEGQNLHQTRLESGAYVVIGNESNGISEAVAQRVTQRITIPRFGGAESLNAGIATAIVLDNWRRGLEA